MPESVSDDALIARCLQRDEAAWRTLIDRYASYVYTIITRAFGFQGDDAREMFQESWVAVFEGLRGYRREGAFRAWLRQVVRNSCAASLRKRRPTEALDEDRADQRQEEMLEQVERAYVLTQALHELDEPCRKIMDLFFFQAQSYQAIAEALAIPEGTVGSRLARCLTKLRTRVHDLT